MDQSQKDQLIDQFQAVTQAAQKSAAIFYLESAHWDLDSAVAQYFESSEHPDFSESTPPSPPPSVSPSHPPAAQPGPPSSRPHPTQAPQPTNVAPVRRPAVRSGGPVTLNDVKAREDDDDEDVQNYYTGGEKSGMMVQDPQPKKGRDAFVKGLFQAARESGADTADESMMEDRQAPRTNPFAGSGYRLGETEGPSFSVNHTRSNENVQPQGRFRVKLTLWANGYTLNDGPLRDFDPAFFQKLLSREIPQEIREMAPGQEIDLFMVDHRQEEYTAPAKPQVTAFSGTGHVLGGQTLPTTTTSTTTSTPPPASSTPFVLDESKPITSLQIRLHDGTRMVARFNHHHTIQDLRGFIDRSRAGPARPYILRSGFPAKVLSEDQNGVTLAEAGLLNAVVVQSFS